MKKLIKPIDGEKKSASKSENSENQSNCEGFNEDDLLEKFIGIKNFDSTKVKIYIIKNKSHVESDLYAIFKPTKLKRKYRQFMNRKGGSNRSLDKL